jgi:hypothetical protein
MKRTTLTASLLGSAAAGLIATAIAAPAWAQATTYPEGTDCSAISNSTNRTECMNQMNESRQNAAPGSVTPSPDGSGNIQQGAPNAPDNRPTTGSSPNNGQGSNTGAGGDAGTNGAGTSN